MYDEPPAEIIDIEPENLQAVLQGMRDLVVSGSVAYYFKDCVADAAAKTGTAQTGGKVSNGVFVAFAPYDDPQIALAVVIEKGGSGGALASTLRARREHRGRDGPCRPQGRRAHRGRKGPAGATGAVGVALALLVPSGPAK